MKTSNKTIILDKNDRRLLRELDRNSRQSYSALSKKLSIPQETVRYRINSLLKRGVISSFFTVIDVGKLGAGVHKVLFKLHNVDEPQVQEIIEHLVSSPAVNWVARFDGLYDVGFTIWVDKIRELNDFVEDLKNQYSANLVRLILAVNIEADFLVRDYLTGSERKVERPAAYSTPESDYHVDRKDRAILKALAVDPRVSASDIGREVGLSSETIQQRIRNLERQRVVTGYRLVLDSAIIGELNYYILVYLKYVSQDQIEKFASYCRAHRSITYIIKALGEWDYELNIEVSNMLEYREVMMELTREFPDIIRDYYGMPVSKIHKFTIMP